VFVVRVVRNKHQCVHSVESSNAMYSSHCYDTHCEGPLKEINSEDRCK
jgi:hypothetical protein